jgi:hypothetical protein
MRLHPEDELKGQQCVLLAPSIMTCITQASILSRGYLQSITKQGTRGEVVLPAGTKVVLPAGTKVALPAGTKVALPAGTKVVLPAGTKVAFPCHAQSVAATNRLTEQLVGFSRC